MRHPASQAYRSLTWPTKFVQNVTEMVGTWLGAQTVLAREEERRQA